MQDVLPEGGVIRKLWIGETAKYRDHMLRLDPASRRSRFGGGVSDDFIRGYVNLSVSLDAVVHGFFVGGVMRGAAARRPFPAPSGGRDQCREALAESRRRLGADSLHLARRAQPQLPTAAHGLSGREPPHAAARAQVRRRTVLRFRRRHRRSGVLTLHPAIADARIHGRRPRLRDRDARPAVALLRA
jgi:hypothetical protein